MRFIGFGCSWMYGSELLDPELPEEARDALEGMRWHKENTPYREQHSFLNLIAKRKSINLAEPGNSLWGMLYRFVEYEKKPENFYVFALTSASRQSWYNADIGKWEHSSWVQHDTASPFYSDFKNFMASSYSTEYERITYQTVVESIAGICESNNLKYVMFNALPNPLHPKVFWSGTSMMEQLEDRHFAPGEHPNEEGHRWIAGRVREFIDSKYPGLL